MFSTQFRGTRYLKCRGRVDPLQALAQSTMRADFSSLPDDIIYILAKSLKEEDTVDAYTLMLLVSSGRSDSIPFG